MARVATCAPPRKIAVVGLGYVGLPAALALGRAFPDLVGFDTDPRRTQSLAAKMDTRGETDPEALAETKVRFSHDPKDLRGRDFYVVAVPTPIDAAKRPDLGALRAATKTVGQAMRTAAPGEPAPIVVYESTVYPGVTEQICGPILEQVSGLRVGRDFFLAYSPERINPGDQERGFCDVVKVVSAQTPKALEIVASVYGSVVTAGVHRASSIAVAEASKVIENVQRDLNIALMNELAIIFDALGIDTGEVIDAAATKWNFLRFSPGLVGGHCIGVDPYYLTARAEEVGIRPEVILAGRRTNDGMGRFVAQKTVKAMRRAGLLADARVGVLGLAFKENVRDVRNSRVFDVVRELLEFGLGPVVHDPLVDPGEARGQGIELRSLGAALECEAVVLAVPHDGLADKVAEAARRGTVKVLVDVKAAISRRDLPPSVHYWSL